MRSLRWGLIGAGAVVLIGSSVHPAQTAFIETLQEQGTSVVAAGSGTIDLTALGNRFGSGTLSAAIASGRGLIFTGPTASEPSESYVGLTGPLSFGSSEIAHVADSGSGDTVGIWGEFQELLVPAGYISGTPLASTAMWDNASFTSLKVTPGIYVWTWGSGATADSFDLCIGDVRCPIVFPAAPAPLIGRGLPLFLTIGGILIGAKLLERKTKRRLLSPLAAV
jgi:hypothetical protein